MENVHWTLVVVDFIEKKIQCYDSTGTNDWRILFGVFRYLKDEHRVILNKDLDGWEWQTVACPRTPRQTNGVDCGVFVAMFADFVSNDYPLLFDQREIDACLERMVVAILLNKAPDPNPR